jgi:hypothetical protein
MCHGLRAAAARERGAPGSRLDRAATRWRPPDGSRRPRRAVCRSRGPLGVRARVMAEARRRASLDSRPASQADIKYTEPHSSLTIARTPGHAAWRKNGKCARGPCVPGAGTQRQRRSRRIDLALRAGKAPQPILSRVRRLAAARPNSGALLVRTSPACITSIEDRRRLRPEGRSDAEGNHRHGPADAAAPQIASPPLVSAPFTWPLLIPCP